MIAEKNFDIGLNPTKVFVSDIPIKGGAYCRVFIDEVGEGSWVIVSDTSYNIINDSIIFQNTPIGKFLSIQVATTPTELLQSPTENTMILAIKNDIIMVANNITDVDTVANSITNVNTVGDSILDVIQVSNMSDNIDTVLLSKDSVDTVANSITNVNTVGDSILDVIQVSNMSDNIDTVAQVILAGDLPILNSVVNYIDTINELSLLDNTVSSVFYVREQDREGIFRFSDTGIASDGLVYEGIGGYWIRDIKDSVDLKWFNNVDNFFAYTGSKCVSKGINNVNITNVQNFLDSLTQLTIKDGATLTVTLPSGEHTATQTTVIQGIGLKNLLVLGQPHDTYTVSNIAITSVGAGNHTQAITLSTTPTVSINDYVIVKSLTGTGNFHTLQGIWKVTNVVGSVVTVQNTCRKATIGAFTITGGSLIKLNTVLKYNGISGLRAFTDAGWWGRMAIVGDGVAGSDVVGVTAREGAFIKLASSTNYPLGVHGFNEHGITIATTGGASVFDAFSCANGQNGLYNLDGVDTIATRIICNGNGLSGVVASVNSSIACSQGVFCGNGQRGVATSGVGVIVSASAFIKDNVESGVRALDNSHINIQSSTLSDNPTHVRSDDNSYVNATSITIQTDAGAFNYTTTNNGKINTRGKITSLYGAGSGVSASSTADNIVIDTDTAGGLSILTPESAYGYINFGNSVGGSTEAGLFYRGTSNALNFQSQGAIRYSISSSNHFLPATDNTQNFGSATFRANTVYAGTGTINTSDDREKCYLDMTENEKLVGIELSKHFKKFKFLDAINAKGLDKARIHFGTSAQTVKALFEKYGLDGFDYAVLCYDEWEAKDDEVILDDEGNEICRVKGYKAGNRYGIRYEQLMCFILASVLN